MDAKCESITKYFPLHINFPLPAQKPAFPAAPKNHKSTNNGTIVLAEYYYRHHYTQTEDGGGFVSNGRGIYFVIFCYLVRVLKGAL